MVAVRAPSGGSSFSRHITWENECPVYVVYGYDPCRGELEYDENTMDDASLKEAEEIEKNIDKVSRSWRVPSAGVERSLFRFSIHAHQTGRCRKLSRAVKSNSLSQTQLSDFCSLTAAYCSFVIAKHNLIKYVLNTAVVRTKGGVTAIQSVQSTLTVVKG